MEQNDGQPSTDDTAPLARSGVPVGEPALPWWAAPAGPSRGTHDVAPDDRRGAQPSTDPAVPTVPGNPWAPQPSTDPAVPTVPGNPWAPPRSVDPWAPTVPAGPFGPQPPAGPPPSGPQPPTRPFGPEPPTGPPQFGPQAPAGPPPYGAHPPVGVAPYGPGAFGTPPWQGPGVAGSGSQSSRGSASGKRSSTTKFVAVLVAVALVAALVGGIVGALAAGGGARSAGTTSAAPLPVASPASGGAAKTLDVAAIAAKLDPAVVDIDTVLGYPGQVEGGAAGTGMIVTPSGEIITNNHVVEGAISIKVRIAGKGASFPAKVIGTDPTDDVALLQVEGVTNLPTVQLGDSNALTVGEPVVAIGNAMGLGGPPTVTSGIISALGRAVNASDEATGLTEHLHGLLQTDAPINPGNSGGPLVNAAGQVIGMNTAALIGSQSQPAGNIGFAIPIDRAVHIADQIRAGVHSPALYYGTTGFLGVGTEALSHALATQAGVPSGTGGVFITQVLTGTPAARAGIATGDVIVAVDGSTTTSPTALRTAIQRHEAGQRISVTWIAAGTRRHATVTLEAGPEA